MLEEFKQNLDTCFNCPKLCQSACPVAMTDGNEAHTPWGLMQIFNLVRKGELPMDEEVAALSYQCLSCKACTDACDHHNDITPTVMKVRKLAVEYNITPPEITGFLAKFHRHNNPFSKDLLQKLKTLVHPKYLVKESPVTYFSSCTTLTKTPEVIEDTFELFQKLNIDFVSAYPETIQCCGYPLLSGGMEEDFIDLAEINYNTLKKYKTIISGSPSCVYTLRETYKKYDFDLSDKVVSITEFIEPYLQNINFRIKKNIKTKLLYHDPCYLSRYLGEVERPRDMISQVSGYKPLEFQNHGTSSGCSGQGGCFSVVSQDVSNDICKRQLEEVKDRNVQTLVTHCPSCVHKFRKNSDRLVVKDLISYFNDCIEGINK